MARPEGLLPAGRLGTERLVGKPGRLGRRIRVEGGRAHFLVARPEAEADDLVRIGLACDRVGVRVLSGARAREASMARSRPCQRRCTGLVLSQNQPANSCSVQSIRRSACQNRSTASRSYDECSVSSAKGRGDGNSVRLGLRLHFDPPGGEQREEALVERRNREPSADSGANEGLCRRGAAPVGRAAR
jgi:hypothetical protein